MNRTLKKNYSGCLLGGACLLFSALPVWAADSAQAAASSNGDEMCGVSVTVEFREGAPRDRFQFVNASAPGWQVEAISLRLESTVGKLVFDTEAGGKGVEVYQLFEVESGSAKLDVAELPDDGGTTLDLSFSQFAAGDSFMFSIDVDDQLSNSERGQIIVSDSEVAGGIVAVSMRNEAGVSHAVELVFDSQSRTEISKPAC